MKITVVSFVDKTSCVILQLEHSVQHWLSCVCFRGSEHIWGTHVEIPSSSLYLVRALGKAIIIIIIIIIIIKHTPKIGAKRV